MDIHYTNRENATRLAGDAAELFREIADELGYVDYAGMRNGQAADCLKAIAKLPEATILVDRLLMLLPALVIEDRAEQAELAALQAKHDEEDAKEETP